MSVRKGRQAIQSASGQNDVRFGNALAQVGDVALKIRLHETGPPQFWFKKLIAAVFVNIVAVRADTVRDIA